MKRISKKVREEAALICAIAAFRANEVNSVDYLYTSIADDLGASRESAKLSLDAFCYGWRLMLLNGMGSLGGRCGDGHAESLLRTGWSPS